MNKEKKEELKKVFSIINPQKFLAFAKTYASKNEDFANAIIDHFIPQDNPIDYQTAIAECFNHKRKGRRAVYELIYDWTAIRQDSKRVIKLLNILIEAGDQHSAIDGAFLFLETFCYYFQTENYGCNNFYEGRNFYASDALNIINSLLSDTNSDFSKNEKLRFIERLKKLNTSNIFDYYLYIDLGSFIRKIQENVLNEEEMRIELDKQRSQSDEYNKTYGILKKIGLLH